MTGRELIAVTAAALVAAVAVSVVAAGWDRLPGELRTVREVQSWPFPGQSLSDIVRSVTGTQVTLAVGAAAVLALFATGARAEALGLALALLLLGIWQPAIKDIVDRPRPTGELVEIRGSITSESFPAGHVMSPAVLWGYALWLLATGRLPAVVAAPLATLSLALLALTGPVNLWLGVHWPLDVLGGYLWGAALALCGVTAARGMRSADRRG
ncbi:MAG TPA: phosphatase PAP2 family protein [Dehalococcoidia bacterium]|nr:phosphatase PAP2 family protein [Dehalococcoidia bacterium]